MYPIIMIPMNWGDITCWLDGLEVIFVLSGISVDIKTDVPINAPPIIKRIVKVFDLILNPIP